MTGPGSDSAGQVTALHIASGPEAEIRRLRAWIRWAAETTSSPLERRLLEGALGGAHMPPDGMASVHPEAGS